MVPTIPIFLDEAKYAKFSENILAKRNDLPYVNLKADCVVGLYLTFNLGE